jgi:murein L,D-transpeptidase YafK
MRTRSLIILFCATAFVAALAWAHWPETPIDPSSPVTQIVILKAQRELILYSNDKPLKTYRVALGRHPVGSKQVAGDEKTPEGEYVISGRNPRSPFHLSLHISYPAPAELASARAKGIDPGGEIMIHGIKRGLGWIGKFQRFVDWTQGCVAVTNEEIEEIYRVVPDGTKVTIKRD